MTLDTFFKKFDQFADAPNAVAKMRELVLELASKGALSERRASDQTDSAWRKFTSELDSRGKRLEPDSSLPFGIPDAWHWVTLDDLGTTKIRNDVDDDTLVSFVSMTLISAKYGVPAQSEERSWREVKKGFTHFAEGDVVMAKITPCFENAKSAVMRNLVNGVGAGTTELLVFRGETKIILPEFVLIYLKTRGFIMRGEPRMTGSAGQKRVPRDYFAGSPFPFPPLAEQKRIVAKVDELMALCDRLEAQQQEREEQASALARASLARFAKAPTAANLNLLFHRSYDIPHADLRKAIYQAAFDGVLTSQSRPSASTNGMPVGWTLLDIASLCVIEDGDRGSFYPKKTDFSGAGHCVFLNTKNVRRHGFEFATLEWISETKHKQLRKGTLVRGDIVFTSRGTIGNIAHYDDAVQFDVMRINSGMFILRGFQKHMEASFLSRLLRSPQIRTQIDELQSGSAQPQLPIREFRKFTAKIPPLDEQRQIVAKVDQLMAFVDQLETQLATSRATAKNLLEAFVAELNHLKAEMA